jgi:hypothetical protein
MHGSVTVQHAGLVIVAGIDLWVRGNGIYQRADQKWQQRQMLAPGMGLVEHAAQFLQRSNIDLLDIREMRDLPLRFLQMFGDCAAQTDDRHLLDAVAPHQTGGSSWGRARAGRNIGVEVLHCDAAAWTGAGDELQLYPEIPGAPPHRW